MTEIKIKTGSVEMEAELNDSKTARKILDALPIEGKVNTWGEEIYFDIPVMTELENGVEVVKEGDLGYWPDGNCFCIFFGKTPVSTENEIKPYSSVSPIGRVCGDPRQWKKVKPGEKITIERG